MHCRLPAFNQPGMALVRSKLKSISDTCLLLWNIDQESRDGRGEDEVSDSLAAFKLLLEDPRCSLCSVECPIQVYVHDWLY